MSPEFFNQKELSYLRFLANRLINEEVAGAMLEDTDLKMGHTGSHDYWHGGVGAGEGYSLGRSHYRLWEM